MAPPKFYAVAAGRTTGIFTDWPTAEKQVKGFAGARYKGFSSRGEAEAWLRNPAPASVKPKKPAQTGGQAPTAENHPANALLVYTDGGAINNPGPGGYGIVICDGESRREFCGGFRLTTNNRMEMTACIEALRQITGCGRPVVLYSDSSYLVNGISKGWAKSWRSRGWRKSDGAAALNVDLWAELLDLLEEVNVIFRWVKGHAGNPLNEACDRLAVSSARGKDLSVDHGYERSL